MSTQWFVLKRNANLHHVIPISRSIVAVLPRLLRVGFKRHICIFRNKEQMHWYYDVRGIDAVAKFMIRKTLQSNINARIDKAWKKHAEMLVIIFNLVDKTSMRSLKREQLLLFYKTLIRALEYESAFGTMSDFLSSDLIPKTIRKYLMRIGIHEASMDEWIGVSTISLTLSPYFKEQELFLKIARGIQRRLNIEQQCKRYVNQYWYVQNDYAYAKKLSTTMLLQRVKQYIRDGHDPEKELHKIHIERGAIVRKKKWLIREAEKKHEGEFIKLLQMIDVHVMLWDMKKVMMQQAFYYMDIVLAHIGKQFGIPLASMQWYTPAEVERLLLHRIVPLSKRIIAARRKSCILEVTQRSTRVFIGKRVLAITKSIEGNLNTKTHIIHGIVGNAGVVRGTVRVVVNPRAVSQLKKGTILVTGMTTPDFIPLMKSAAAIITDEGGVTCHAAIISREMQKPCIIGTKNATKVLKDGDLVEVDATDGIVRKLS